MRPLHSRGWDRGYGHTPARNLGVAHVFVCTCYRHVIGGLWRRWGHSGVVSYRVDLLRGTESSHALVEAADRAPCKETTSQLMCLQSVTQMSLLWQLSFLFWHLSHLECSIWSCCGEYLWSAPCATSPCSWNPPAWPCGCIPLERQAGSAGSRPLWR